MSGSSFSYSPGVGLADVARFEAVTAVFRGLDYRDGGGSCRSAVDHLRTWGEEALAAARTDRARARMLVAQADLIANIYYRMGRVELHRDEAGQALQLFQLGRAAARESGSAHAAAILCANEAWAHANLGATADAEHMLGQAADLLAGDGHGRVPGWAAFFTGTELMAMTGSVYTELALRVDRRHTGRAVRALAGLSRATTGTWLAAGRSALFPYRSIIFSMAMPMRRTPSARWPCKPLLASSRHARRTGCDRSTHPAARREPMKAEMVAHPGGRWWLPAHRGR